MLPQAYVYPAGMRATRDLLRRRLHIVRKSGQLLAHIQNTSHQYNLPPLGKRIAYPSNRGGVAEHFEDRVVQKSIAVDLALLERYDALVTDLESYLVRQAKQHDPQAFALLRSIPGVGKVLGLTILYEIHDVRRFDRVQQFASYARLVKCAKESAGKRHGTRGAKMGNVHLKWAFSEAAVLFVRHSAQGKPLLARLEQRFGKGKAPASSLTSSGALPTTSCCAARRSRAYALHSPEALIARILLSCVGIELHPTLPKPTKTFGDALLPAVQRIAAKLRPRMRLSRSDPAQAARVAEARGRQMQRLVGRPGCYRSSTMSSSLLKQTRRNARSSALSRRACASALHRLIWSIHLSSSSFEHPSRF